MPTYGRQATFTTGMDIAVIAGSYNLVGWKTGGITLDWTTITAVGTNTTLADGNVIPAGQVGIQFGVILCKITASGKYGPYASGATDGRQLLNRGDCWILNKTVLQLMPSSVGSVATDHPAVFNAGRVFFDRLQVVGGAAATFLGATSQPTLAAFETAFPAVDYVKTAS